MIENCEHHRRVWLAWQSRPEDAGDELSPETLAAVDHIARCPDCLARIPRLAVRGSLRLTPEGRARSIAAMAGTVNEKGITQAVEENVALAVEMLENESVFALALAASAAVGRERAGELPPDVAFGLECHLSRDPRLSESFRQQMGDAGRATLALELRLSRERAELALDMLPRYALMNEGTQAFTRSHDAAAVPLSPRARKSLPIDSTTRSIEVTVEGLGKAHLVVDARRGVIALRLPASGRYKEHPPLVSLLPGSGGLVARRARLHELGYEALFEDVRSGQYLLAVDLVPARGKKVDEYAAERIVGEDRTESRGLP